jgi:polysaccharide pyruvyl transferase WcaK-like protein
VQFSTHQASLWEITGWLARKFEYWSAAGVPVVLLPQALGPFKDPETRSSARRALKAVSLVWARDSTSYDSVVNLLGDDASVGIAPDMTIADEHNAEVRDRVIERPSTSTRWKRSSGGVGPKTWKWLASFTREKGIFESLKRSVGERASR